MTDHLAPPSGYGTWLDYATILMPPRDGGDSARAELAALRARVAELETQPRPGDLLGRCCATERLRTEAVAEQRDGYARAAAAAVERARAAEARVAELEPLASLGAAHMPQPVDPDEARRGERRLLGDAMTDRPAPPPGHASWLDYAVWRCDRADAYDAARAELVVLRADAEQWRELTRRSDIANRWIEEHRDELTATRAASVSMTGEDYQALTEELATLRARVVELEGEVAQLDRIVADDIRRRTRATIEPLTESLKNATERAQELLGDSANAAVLAEPEEP